MKEAQKLASKISTKGATLYDLLSKKTDLRIRYLLYIKEVKSYNQLVFWMNLNGISSVYVRLDFMGNHSVYDGHSIN